MNYTIEKPAVPHTISFILDDGEEPLIVFRRDGINFKGKVLDDKSKNEEIYEALSSLIEFAKSVYPKIDNEIKEGKYRL